MTGLTCSWKFGDREAEILVFMHARGDVTHFHVEEFWDYVSWTAGAHSLSESWFGADSCHTSSIILSISSQCQTSMVAGAVAWVLAGGSCVLTCNFCIQLALPRKTSYSSHGTDIRQPWSQPS